MQDELVISDPKVADTLLDPFRYRLFRLFVEPRTVPEAAEAIGTPANRLYYHVRRLVKAGLIEQVDARPRGKHTERVYGPAAHKITFAEDLQLPSITERRVPGVVAEVFNEISAAIEADMAGEFGEDSPGVFSWLVGRLTAERAKEFQRRFQELMREFGDEKPSEDASPYGILAVVTPLPKGDRS